MLLGSIGMVSIMVGMILVGIESFGCGVFLVVVRRCFNFVKRIKRVEVLFKM